MLTMMLAGMTTVLALIVTMARIDLRKCLGYATPIDIAFTAGMLFMFHGTFHGIVAAAFAGLFMSLTLSVLVKIIGYQRMRVVRFHWMRMPSVEWIDVAPKAFRFNGASVVSRLATARDMLHRAHVHCSKVG